jgi:hypothetical protein
MSYLCCRRKQMTISMVTRILRFVYVSFLLIVFIAGNTGVSFFVHTCGSTHKQDVFIYREVFHQQMSCCCEAEPGEPTPAVTSFSDADCCRLSHHFVKASFTALPVFEKIPIPSTGIILFPSFALLRSDPVGDSKVTVIPFPDHSPPPLSGIRLIHFIHQIRIPSPVC